MTMVIQHTVLLGLYGKLFHSYQFSSLVRFKTTSLNWISLVMKIDIRGIISHTTLVGMLYYYNTNTNNNTGLDFFSMPFSIPMPILLLNAILKPIPSSIMILLRSPDTSTRGQSNYFIHYPETFTKLDQQR